MHARSSSFKTILGPSTFSKLVQFAIFGYKCLTDNMGVRRIFFRASPLLKVD